MMWGQTPPYFILIMISKRDLIRLVINTDPDYASAPLVEQIIKMIWSYPLPFNVQEVD